MVISSLEIDPYTKEREYRLYAGNNTKRRKKKKKGGRYY